jgi:TRAP-type C4-dicarboxylate transport system substrate-binding protein
MKLPVYSRADLSRTGAVVVALFLTAVSTSAVSREFRVADTQNEDYPTVQALRYMGNLIAEQSGGRHQIRVFHSHQLGEEKQTIERTCTGAIELNRSNGALIVTEHAMSSEVLVMSQQAWESLSSEVRRIFRDTANRSSRFMRAKWKDLEERSRRQAEAAGVTIGTDFDRKPFETAMAEIYAKAARDPATWN